MYLIIILFTLALLLRISYLFIIILHELGHAIPGMYLSKNGATVYFGSYGNVAQSYKFTIGKLTIFALKNPIKWRGGMCVLDKPMMSPGKNIIHILTGPLTPFILAAILCSSAMYFDLHGSVKLFSVAFLGVTIFSMFHSLIPSKRSLRSIHGIPVRNDGYQVVHLIKTRKIQPLFIEAVQLFDAGRYAEAAHIFHHQILDKFRYLEYFKMTTLAYLHAKDYHTVREIVAEHQQHFPFDADDFTHAALAYSATEESQQALLLYKQALDINPEHKYALNNMGFTLNNIGEYQEAIQCFNRAIKVSPDFAYAFNNRGHAKVMINDFEGGFADIQQSFELDPDNAYGFRNLGIYHLRKLEYREALELFEKAKAIDPDTYEIDKYIAEAKKAIG